MKLIACLWLANRMFCFSLSADASMGLIMDDRLPQRIDISLSGLDAGQSISITVNAQTVSDGDHAVPTTSRAASAVAITAADTFAFSKASSVGLSSVATKGHSSNVVPSFRADSIYRCVLSEPYGEPIRWRWLGLRSAFKWCRRMSSVCEVYPPLRDASSSLLAVCAAAIALTW